jgi:hypothetical protein
VVKLGTEVQVWREDVDSDFLISNWRAKLHETRLLDLTAEVTAFNANVCYQCLALCTS